MMEENPSWWSMHRNLRSSTSNDDQQQSSGVSSNMLLSQTHPYPSLMPTIHYPHHDHHQGQHFPNSWSQLLLGGLAREEEERYGLNLFQTTKGMSKINLDDGNVKQEDACTNQHNNLVGYHHYEQLEVGVDNRGIAWSQNMPTSSPISSCVTSLSSNTNDTSDGNTMLDFSTSKRSLHEDSHQHLDHSNSECNSTSDDLAEGVSNKKTKVQSLSTPLLKVRKEKLGDRITSLHQLVSPFGKTDTASVLLEAIGYIRFLQGQIEALTSPYLGNDNAPANSQHPIHGERNCLFPDHPEQEYKDKDLDLKSRGLCLVPLSCTHIVGSDNGADYWAPTLSRGF